MRRLVLSIILFCFCAPSFSQSMASDEELLAKTRALYDAPFTRELISFDCAVQFDWKKHFVDVLGTIPPVAIPVTERLQTVQHRVFVDRSGAVVSAIPKAPDLTSVTHAAELEQGLSAIVSSGLNAWLPFSTNVILPVQPTKSSFQKIDQGYKLTMNGRGVAATLLLKTDMRVTSGVVQPPQPMRFTTEFIDGPNGYLLASVRTGSTTSTDTDGVATFSYTYQAVQGFQLPSLVTVTSSSSEKWQYTLTDCKAMRGVIIKVGLPKQ
jgi:hypothetical protein